MRTNTRQRAAMTPQQYDAFRTQMKQLRKEAHLGQSELGEMVDITGVHVGNIERGNRYPSDGLAKDIANVFGLTVEEMYLSADERRFKGFEETAKKYRTKRKERGFKQFQVAGFLGIPNEIYLEFEEGKCSIGESMINALDLLYAVDTKIETVEVTKEIPAEPLISLETIEKVLSHISDLSISTDEQRALFREFSTARTSMLEAKLFG